ncbi:hypothetical protein DJ94_4622 [Bacillus pseudomycoides]|nr:hypothetical protein DJ94_4622 [Bacillus pseudomycoides]
MNRVLNECFDYTTILSLGGSEKVGIISNELWCI